MKKLIFFDNTVEVFIFDESDFIKPDSPALSSIVSNLSFEEQDKFYRYKNISAQYQYLTAHYYLRQILSKKLGEKPNQIKIGTHESGKPFLLTHPTLKFNISHTKNMVLAAFSEFQVGVDVEQEERSSDMLQILKHFFSEKEVESFLLQPEKDRNKAFYTGWTRKEAILKATGEGLSALKTNEVSFAPNAKNAIISDSSENKIMLADFTPAAGYCGCVVKLLQK